MQQLVTMDLVNMANQLGEKVISNLTAPHKKTLGQYMTPPEIALFMAKKCVIKPSNQIVKILEPAAGTGILIAALVQVILENPQDITKIEITAYEIDPSLVEVLNMLKTALNKAIKIKGIKFKMQIFNKDFLLSEESKSTVPHYDVILANPPYFKINAQDERAKIHFYAVHGQPNIYGLFMASCAKLVNPGGRWCFITPRSWTTGAYFSLVRNSILKHLAIDSMHVFESRSDHFSADKILQEAMITWATVPGINPTKISLSTSNGALDLNDSAVQVLSSSNIITTEQEINIPYNLGTFQFIKKYAHTFDSYGLRVSTGPVIAFRAKEFISNMPGKQSVPLLWMQHVTAGKITWPINKKEEHIALNAASAYLLLKNSNYVLTRRFSPKEDYRRVIAAPYLSSIPAEYIGLENHLNFIHRPGGALSAVEAIGISSYLNSVLVDEYHRSVSGGTQVNAGDLRKMPLPDFDLFIKIGEIIRPSMLVEEIDEVVSTILGNGSQKYIRAVK